MDPTEALVMELVGGIRCGDPIVRDSSTGCWTEVIRQINDRQEVKRAVVTISGPERYGLADAHINTML